MAFTKEELNNIDRNLDRLGYKPRAGVMAEAVDFVDNTKRFSQYNIIFRRDANNNKITGRVQYRVRLCCAPYLEDTVANLGDGDICILTDRPKRKGTIINPRHELFGKPKRIR